MSLQRTLRVGVQSTLIAVALLLTTVFGVFGNETSLAAQSVPYKVNFQGRLTDSSGNILTDGSYNVKFRLFDALSAGTNKWEEDRVFGSSDNRITVQNGLFNIQFGDLTPITPALFSGAFPLFLEVELPTPATAICASNGCASFTEGAMTPRQPMASSPYAISADTLDGFDSTSFIFNQTSQQTSSNFNISGVGVAGSALQAPIVDTATSIALGIGTTHATAINLQQSTTVAATKLFTVTSGLTSLTANTTGDALHVSNDTSTGSIAVLSDGTTPVLTVANEGVITVQNSTDSTSSFQVLTAGLTPKTVLNIDTSNQAVTLDANLLVTSSVPTPVGISVSDGGNSGGSLSGASTSAYYYQISGITVNGESPASREVVMSGSLFTPITPPVSAPTITFTGSSSLTGAYYYRVSFVTNNGETTAEPVTARVSPVSRQVVLNAIPTGPSDVIARKIYRTKKNGLDGTELYDATISDNITTTYTDSALDASLGSAMPQINTARTDSNQAIISYGAMAGATSYRIYRGTSSGGESEYQTTTSTTFTDTGATGTAGTPIDPTTGRLGVGTTTPGYKLDVEGGNINVSGAYVQGSGNIGQTASCSANQTFSGLSISGGIVTGIGACGPIGGGGSVSTLQTVYNNSASPEIQLGSSADSGLTILDNSTPISGNLFEVQDSAATTNYFSVSSTGITSSGNLTLGTSTSAGSIVLNDGTSNAYSVTLGTPALTGSYNINLPNTAPSISQCLKSSSTSASQLEWAGCGGGAVQAFDNSTASFTSGLANVAANASGIAAETLVFTSATTVSNVAGATGFTAPASGSFRTCLVKNNANITAGTLSLRWRVNGVSVGSPACNMDSTVANRRSATSSLDTGVVTFAAGDTIGIAFDTDAAYLPITADYTAYWTVEYNATSSLGSVVLQGGNSFAATAVIGTSDNNDVTFVTNGVEQVRIDTSGNVGIGKTSTGPRLDVNGTVNANAFTSSGTISSGGAIAAPTLLDTINGLIINAGALSGATGLSLTSGDITTPGNISTSGSGSITSAGAITGTSVAAGAGNVTGSTGSFSTSLLAALHDIASAGQLNIGTSFATSIVLGKAGVSVSAPGGITTSNGTINTGSGAITSTGTITGNLFSGSGVNLTNLNPTNLVQGTGTVTLQSAAGAALAITSNAAATWATTGANNLTINSGGGTLIAGANTTTLQKAGAAFAIDLNNAATSTLTVTNSNASFVANLSVEGAVGIGTGQVYSVGATAGSTISACTSSQYLSSASAAGGIMTGGSCVTNDLQNVYNNSSSPATINETAAKGFNLVAAAPPTADMLNISNVGQPVATNSVNGLGITYIGGAVPSGGEASAEHIDITPGSTNPSTWNGLHIVSNTGAGVGVNFNGIKIEGPGTPLGGTETGLNITTGWDIGVNVQSGGLQLSAMANPTTNPASGDLRVYAKLVVGRTMLKALPSTGVDYVYQPSLFQQNVFMVTPGSVGGTAGALAIGAPITTTGTYTNASQANQVGGFQAQYSTGTTLGTTAGFIQTLSQYYRGSAANGNNGFFAVQRILLPDATIADYTSATTGSRIWAGLSSQTAIATMVSSDAPTGDFAGFRLSGSAGETTWRFLTRNNATTTNVNTGVTAAANKEYDFYIYCKPFSATDATQNQTIYWRLDNLTDGVAPVEGSQTLTLPTATTGMRFSLAIRNISAAARLLDYQRVYIETDR